ncbi:MAG TPA: DNA-formamidopyrimidine glycosylase family protein [Solimonas sp.]|nr:DNA-formamidopyrimidine glycosylase family protein [Solimonas sp.]
MQELPDLEVYLDRIEALAGGQVLQRLRIGNPFVLRSVALAPSALHGRRLLGSARIGKRLVLKFEGGACAVIHLMVLGRLHWKPPEAKLPKGSGLAAFDFDTGSLQLTESGSKRRAALHLVGEEIDLLAFDRGGLEPLALDAGQFCERLARDSHTLKRALTDPTIFAGIGNAYSDEILHQAQLSPFKQTRALSRPECQRLFDATQLVMREWTERLRVEAQAAGWPKKVTAFRPEMAVHGKFGQPCPVCGTKVQRIVYADNQANYCPRCQTEGRVLADRALSRLLKDSWPRSIEELEK